MVKKSIVNVSHGRKQERHRAFYIKSKPPSRLQLKRFTVNDKQVVLDNAAAAERRTEMMEKKLNAAGKVESELQEHELMELLSDLSDKDMIKIHMVAKASENQEDAFKKIFLLGIKRGIGIL